MRKFMNKLKVIAIILAVTITTFVSSASSVYAWTGGGSAGGGYNPYDSGAWLLRKNNTHNGSSAAWHAFLNEAVQRSGTIATKEAYVKGRLSGSEASKTKLIEGCRKSNYVWYLAYGNSPYWSDTGAQGSNYLTFPSSSEWTLFDKVFASNPAHRAQWQGGNTILVCSYNLAVAPAPKPRNYTTTDTKKDVTLSDISLDSAVMSTLVRLEKPAEYSSWDAGAKRDYVNRYGGKETTVVQESGLDEVNKLVKDIQAAEKKWANSTQSKIEAEWATFRTRAKAINDKITSPTNVLSDGQKKGLADYGGVFTIENRVRPITIKGPVIEGRSVRTHWKINQEYRNGVLVDVGKPIKVKDEVLKEGGMKQKSVYKESSETLKNYWQILSVICNKAGLEGISSNVAGAKLEKGNGGNGTVYTKLYNANDKKPFGAQGTYTAARSQKFFEQTNGCDFKCVPKHTGDEAFFAKDSDNVEITKNEGKFVYFRDNENRTVKVNQWLPNQKAASNDVIKVEPKRTIFNVIGNGLDEFKVEANNVEISGINHVNSAIDSFGVKSSWASEVDKDQNVDIAWGYNAVMKKYGIPNGVTGTKPGATGGVSSHTGGLSVYCNMGRENAVVENKAMRNIKPESDSIWFAFVRAVGK